MNELLQRLYQLGLSTHQVEQILLTLDTWLEKKYPFISQMYRVQLLEELLCENILGPHFRENCLEAV